jgi:hypothetical protein
MEELAVWCNETVRGQSLRTKIRHRLPRLETKHAIAAVKGGRNEERDRPSKRYGQMLWLLWVSQRPFDLLLNREHRTSLD